MQDDVLAALRYLNGKEPDPSGKNQNRPGQAALVRILRGHAEIDRDLRNALANCLDAKGSPDSMLLKLQGRRRGPRISAVRTAKEQVELVRDVNWAKQEAAIAQAKGTAGRTKLLKARKAVKGP